MKLITSILFAVILATNVFSQNLEKRLDSLFQGHLNSGQIHGCVAYVFQNGNVSLYKPYGYMDVENKRPMEKDAIFRIASMTKALTAAAALKLYEEGKFLLDDPVKKYIPEFANLKVLAPGQTNPDSFITVPLQRDVTVRDLFRHTAGFSYGGDDVVGKLYTRKLSANQTLKQFVMAILTVPLKNQPGSKWEYSFSNDILGYFVEVVSGKPLDEYMHQAVFKPLKMSNTGFYVPENKINKLCNFYEYSNNQLILKESTNKNGVSKRPIFISGGGGGVSTIEDYSKFLQMIMNYGTLNGKRIFKPQTIELLLSNQIGEITNRGFEVDGFSFGIGITPGINNGRVAGGHWAGSPYNDTYSFNLDKKTIAILLMQNAPWGHLEIIDKFQKIVAEETK